MQRHWAKPRGPYLICLSITWQYLLLVQAGPLGGRFYASPDTAFCLLLLSWRSLVAKTQTLAGFSYPSVNSSHFVVACSHERHFAYIKASVLSSVFNPVFLPLIDRHFSLSIMKVRSSEVAMRVMTWLILTRY
jgi:hypothetical protein